MTSLLRFLRSLVARFMANGAHVWECVWVGVSDWSLRRAKAANWLFRKSCCSHVTISQNWQIHFQDRPLLVDNEAQRSAYDTSCSRNESFTQLATLHVLRFLLTPNKPGEDTNDKRQANSCFSTTLSISEVCVFLLQKCSSGVCMDALEGQFSRQPSGCFQSTLHQLWPTLPVRSVWLAVYK